MTPVLRKLIFVLVFLWMAGGPFYRQVLGINDGYANLFRPWKMFGKMGLGVVDARFMQRMPDGTLRDLDRFELLGYSDPSKVPPTLRRLRGKESTRKVAKQLCARLGRDADVRVRSRYLTRKGWIPHFDGSSNLCNSRERRQSRG